MTLVVIACYISLSTTGAKQLVYAKKWSNTGCLYSGLLDIIFLNYKEGYLLRSCSIFSAMFLYGRWNGYH